MPSLQNLFLVPNFNLKACQVILRGVLNGGNVSSVEPQIVTYLWDKEEMYWANGSNVQAAVGIGTSCLNKLNTPREA